MTIKMIICTGLNGEIGYSDGRLAFDCPEDMKYFKEQTTGHNVVMGRKTFESLPFKYGLPDRINHIITSDPRKIPLGLSACDVETMKGVLPIYNSLGGKDTWIIGGASIYEQFLDMVDEIHYTTILKSNAEADIKFNMKLDTKVWKNTSHRLLSKDAIITVWKRKH